MSEHSDARFKAETESQEREERLRLERGDENDLDEGEGVFKVHVKWESEAVIKIVATTAEKAVERARKIGIPWGEAQRVDGTAMHFRVLGEE